MDQFPRPMQVGNGNTWSAQPMSFGAPAMSSPPKWPQISGEKTQLTSERTP